MILEKYNFIHLSTGDLLREEIKNGSKLGRELDEVMKEGKLISSDLMVKLIEEKIARHNYSGRYLLDGFPRGHDNMEVWEKNLAKDVNLRGVLYFECSE